MCASSVSNALLSFMSCHKKMRHIVQNAKNDNAYNSDFSSFNRIERSRLMRSDDAVETFKRHSKDKQCTAHCCGEHSGIRNVTIPFWIGRHIDKVYLSEISAESYKR